MLRLNKFQLLTWEKSKSILQLFSQVKQENKSYLSTIRKLRLLKRSRLLKLLKRQRRSSQRPLSTLSDKPSLLLPQPKTLLRLYPKLELSLNRSSKSIKLMSLHPLRSLSPREQKLKKSRLFLKAKILRLKLYLLLL